MEGKVGELEVYTYIKEGEIKIERRREIKLERRREKGEKTRKEEGEGR